MRVGALEQLDAEVDDGALPEVVGQLDHQVADVRLDVTGRRQVGLRGGHVAIMPGPTDPTWPRESVTSHGELAVASAQIHWLTSELRTATVTP